MYKSTLKEKALKCAIKAIIDATTREEANKVYITWEVFHSNSEFKQAIISKKDEFKQQYGRRD